MSTMKKKQIKELINETAGKLSDILGKHLDKLPSDEREKRIKKANKIVKDVLKTSNASDDHSTPQQPTCNPQTPLAARSLR